MDVETKVRDFLTRELGKDVTRVSADESLLESGTLDSVSVMQLVGFLERTFNITVADDDLMPENFDTMSAIAAFVSQRK